MFAAGFINTASIWPLAVALRVSDRGSIVPRLVGVGGRVFVRPEWRVFATTRSQWPCHSGRRPRCWHRLIKAGWMTRRQRSNIAVTTWPNLLSPQHARGDVMRRHPDLSLYCHLFYSRFIIATFALVLSTSQFSSTITLS